MSIPENLRIRGIAVVAEDDSVVVPHPTSGVLRHLARRLAEAADHLERVERKEAERRRFAETDLGKEVAAAVRPDMDWASKRAAESVGQPTELLGYDHRFAVRVAERVLAAADTSALAAPIADAVSLNAQAHSRSLFEFCPACNGDCSEAPF